MNLKTLQTLKNLIGFLGSFALELPDFLKKISGFLDQNKVRNALITNLIMDWTYLIDQHFQLKLHHFFITLLKWHFIFTSILKYFLVLLNTNLVSKIKKQDKPIFDSIAFTMLSLQVSLCLYCGVIEYTISNQYSTCRQLNFVDISIVECVSIK